MSVPKPLVTDLLTVVEAYSKQRAPRLTEGRLGALEAALAEGHQEARNSDDRLGESGEFSFMSLEALQVAVAAWREEAARVEFDADTHYDGTHVKSYHAKFRVPQERHTRRCLYLLDRAALGDESGNSLSELTPPGDSCSNGKSSTACDLVLDVGCGSGLSSRVLEPFFNFVIGIDASAAMLRRADADKQVKDDKREYNEGRSGESLDGVVEEAAVPPSAFPQTSITKNTGFMVDYVQCNFGHRLPFRVNAFACSTSTSAVHYLVEHPVRMATLVTELERCCVGDSAWQLFPNRGLDDLLQLNATIENPRAPIQSLASDPLQHVPDAQKSSMETELGLATDATPQGKYKHFYIFGDRPHRGSNAAPRWYVQLSRTPREQRRCPAPKVLSSETRKDTSSSVPCLDTSHGAFPMEPVMTAAPPADVSADAVDTVDSIGCALFAPANCLMCAARNTAYKGKTLEDEHWQWLKAEHGRFLKREVRLKRREAALLGNSSAAGSSP